MTLLEARGFGSKRQYQFKIMALVNLAKAVINVMKSIKGIDKGMVVGLGNNSYKGVSDKDVKNTIGEAMEINGLCLLPIRIEAKTQIDRWEENVTYSGITTPKTKQSVLTEVTTKYLLLHESGESIELAGYGHGIDPQDKAAGKATTYALKYTLLYTFLVATGTIDDTDNEHSNDKDVPKGKTVTEPTTDEKAAAMLKQPAPNTLPPSPMTDAHRNAIKNAITKAQVTAIWNDPACTHLRGDGEFIELIKNRGNKLTVR